MWIQKERAGLVGIAGLALTLVCAAHGAGLSLVFTNCGSATGSSVSNYARSTLLTLYSCTQSNDYQYFRGAFTSASSSSKLAVHSDDGCKVVFNGSVVLDQYGVDTHMNDLSTSFRYLTTGALIVGAEYCVEIYYTNYLHTTGDIDGLTLYAYNGGGTMRDGLAVSSYGDRVCPGNTLVLFVSCGTGPYTWTSSNGSVASVDSRGVVTGLTEGTATITATDAGGLTGSKTISVAPPRISPGSFVMEIGVTNTFALTNEPLGGTVVWTPAGATSPDGLTNAVAFNTAGSNVLVTAAHNNCTGLATGVVVAAASLTGPSGACVGDPVIYTASTIPPGYESMLTWSGEGLSGHGTQRTNTYATTGTKVVSVSCGTTVQTFSNGVYRMEITPTNQTALADAATEVAFTLTNSYGMATWAIAPSGGASFSVGNVGDTVLITPGSAGTNYAITASALAAPSCSHTAQLQVVKVTFSTNELALCEGGSAPLSVTVTPSSYLSSLIFDTVTNIVTGATNTSASVSPSSGSTNLTVTGGAAGTATLRVRLGNSIAFGPVIQTVRVSFPTNAWYVAEGTASYFGATVTPAENADVVSYESANSGVALVSGAGTNLAAIGLTNGTTQVLAKVGGQTCASKDLNVVGVRLAPSELDLCAGQSGSFTATITPPSAPVTFSISDPSIASLTQNGNTLTVTSLVAGTTFVVSWLNGAFVSVASLRGLAMIFPTNEFYVPEGSTYWFSVQGLPAFQGSNVSLDTTDTNIARVASPPRLPYVGVIGISNGTTFLRAQVNSNQFCVFKNMTVLPMEKLPLGQALTRSSPGFFKVYVPTRWGGKLTITNTAGTITDLRSPIGVPFANGTTTPVGRHGWYFVLHSRFVRLHALELVRSVQDREQGSLDELVVSDGRHSLSKSVRSWRLSPQLRYGLWKQLHEHRKDPLLGPEGTILPRPRSGKRMRSAPPATTSTTQMETEMFGQVGTPIALGTFGTRPPTSSPASLVPTGPQRRLWMFRGGDTAGNRPPS